MIRTFSINKSVISVNYRFEASFYYYSYLLHSKNVRKGIEYLNLDTLSEKISDGEHSHIPRKKEPGVRYLYGRNIKEGVINFDPISDSSYISEDDYRKSTRTHINQDDILLTIVGTVGKSALYKQEYVGIAGIPRHIAKISVKKGVGVSPEYITVFFRSNYGKRQLDSIKTGNIQPLISIKNIRTLEIPKADHDFLKTITSMERRQVDCEIKSNELIRQALDLFYKCLNVDFSLIQDPATYSVKSVEIIKNSSWIPSFYKPLFMNSIIAIQNRWPTVKLKDIASISKGNEVGSVNYLDLIHKNEKDVPFIRTTDINNYDVDIFPDFYIPHEIYQELRQDVKPNDILFTNDGKIGQVALLTDEDSVILQSHIKRVRLSQNAKKLNITQEYLFVVLATNEIGLYQSQKFTVVQSTIPTISNNLQGFVIPIIDNDSIEEITLLVQSAFLLKNEKKKLLKSIQKMMGDYFEA